MNDQIPDDLLKKVSLRYSFIDKIEANDRKTTLFVRQSTNKYYKSDGFICKLNYRKISQIVNLDDEKEIL